jgi:2-oxoisovalerate dehydrogenase E1 component
VFLHLKVVRLLGHAGSDAETEYHGWEEIEAAEAKDPLLASADLLLHTGLLTPDGALDLYERTRTRVREAAAAAVKTPKLGSAAEIVAPLAPYSPEAVATEARRAPAADERLRIFGGEANLPERGTPRHMAALINLGLHDILIKYPEAIVFGEDVAKKGGVYHVTTGLNAKFGAGRVFNTLLDETTILGLGIGAAHMGLLPIPEIQYLAYYHNAEDQIRGEAGSLQYFSKGKYRNPMVIRIAGWAYQKGFGGHFHNDNSIAALRDVPGVVIATPARGDDAVKMMRTCIEPIALYMTRDLHEPKDGLWSFAYPPSGEFIALGEGAVYRDGSLCEPGAPATGRSENIKKSKRQKVKTRGNRHSTMDNADDDLTIFTFANGLWMSLRAARSLVDQHKIRARVVDLRWLNPLNEAFIVEQSLATGRVLVVDEGRRTGGVAEAILALIHEHCGSQVRAAGLNAQDTYIPLGPAADFVLPQDRDVVARAVDLLGTSKVARANASLRRDHRAVARRDSRRTR